MKIPIKRHFNKINCQNFFNKKIKPRNGCFRENDYRMKNYFNTNNNSNNITYEIPKNKITKIIPIQDFNQLHNFGFNGKNQKKQINTEPINKVSNLYKNDKKNNYEIKIENKNILDNIAQNQSNDNNYNKKILNRIKSVRVKNNNHYKTINNENNEKRLKKAKSNINNRNNISKKNNENNFKYDNTHNEIILSQEAPESYTKICFNIFNKLLKMINNISDIKNYFSNSKKKVIKKCIEVYKNGLAYILVLINNDLSYENELNKFVGNFIKQNSMNENEKLSDIKNVKSIINYIYNKINNELTNIKQTENSAIDNKFYNDHPSLEFMKKYNSIISDLFLGIFHKEVDCQAHQENICKNEIFYVIDFDLKEIHDCISDINNLHNTLFTPIINVDFCFEYYFCLANKTEKKSYCDSCFFETKKSEKKYIYSPPKIITIVLSNTDNYKLDLQKEINISKLIADENKNFFTGIYDLVSTLYITRNERKFIIYSESKEKINQPNDNYSNAIPIMLLYQMRELSDEIKLTLKFQNGIPPKEVTFNKNCKIKEVKQKISDTFKLDINKFFILINGNRTEENEILSKYLRDINDIAIIFIERN